MSLLFHLQMAKKAVYRFLYTYTISYTPIYLKAYRKSACSVNPHSSPWHYQGTFFSPRAQHLSFPFSPWGHYVFLLASRRGTALCHSAFSIMTRAPIPVPSPPSGTPQGMKELFFHPLPSQGHEKVQPFQLSIACCLKPDHSLQQSQTL